MLDIDDENVSKSDLFRKVIRICDMLDFPTAIFNRNLECIYSRNNIIKLGSKINNYTKDDDACKTEDCLSTIFIIKGVQFCVKIIKTEDFIICGLFNINELSKMARNTDFFEKIFPMFLSVKYDVSHLWEIMLSLKTLGQQQLALNMESYLLDTKQKMKNMFNLIDVVLHKPTDIVIDCNRFIEDVVSRCNEILSKCSRRLVFTRNTNKCYIRADYRHIIYVIANVIQNSLLYSERNSSICVSVDNSVNNGKNFVEVKFSCKSDRCIEPLGFVFENNFGSDQTGESALQLIKFIASCLGAEFEFSKEGNQTISVLRVPTPEPSNNEAVFFECDEYVGLSNIDYDNIIDLSMLKIVDYFKFEENVGKSEEDYLKNFN